MRTMKAENMLDVEFSNLRGTDGGTTWNEVSLLGETINNHKNGVVSTRKRKENDEVH